MYLSTKLEVDHNDGNLRTGNDENDENEEEKAEQIVELVLPNGCEDEEQLDEHSSKRKDSSHQSTKSKRISFKNTI